MNGAGKADANRTSGDGQTVASPPIISLPKGGGAIHNIREKFAADPVIGSGSMTVPIATSPGRSGFGPQLALSYGSGAGNGLFGFGWSLSQTFHYPDNRGPRSGALNTRGDQVNRILPVRVDATCTAER
jgi:hypothetical protein